MKKRWISLMLSAVMAVSVLCGTMSPELAGELQVTASAIYEAGLSGDKKAFTDDAFANSLSALLDDYPTENGYAKIVIDTEKNTIQKDDDAPVSLEQYGIDCESAAYAPGLIPLQPLMDITSTEAPVSSAAGKSAAGVKNEECKPSLSASLDSSAEEGEKGELYLSARQAKESFGLEATCLDGKIEIVNPFQTKRLIVETVDSGSLKSTYGCSDFVTDGKGYYVLQYETEETARAAYERFQSDKSVRYTETDRVVKAFAFSDRAGAQTIQSDRYRKYLTENNKTGTVKVAVIDTGVDSTHPVLKARMLKGYNFYQNSTATADVHGHGTHVAGIIADNTPSSVKILPVKVLNDSGEGTELSIKLGIEYAVKQKVKVINLSLGGDCVSGNCPIGLAVKNAVKSGVSVVAAAGNESGDTAKVCPARISECITVASCDTTGDAMSYFSNYGSAVDITAPGDNILSCAPGGDYQYLSGTSMAAPFVTAAAAMLLVNQSTLTPSQVETKLCTMTDDIFLTGRDPYSGSGILDFGVFFGERAAATEISLSAEEVSALYFSKASPCPNTANVSGQKARLTDRSFTTTSTVPSVAVYDGRYVWPKSEGETQITVKLANGESASCTVKVEKKEVWIDYASKSYAGGNGTGNNPYLIGTPEQLARFALDVRNGRFSGRTYYQLTDDIDLAGKDWITAAYTETESFGVGFTIGAQSEKIDFDGKNHIIRNMRVFDEKPASVYGESSSINRDWYYMNTGFLGTLSNAQVKNLGIVNAYSSAKDSGLLAYALMENTKVANCFTTGFSGGSGLVNEVVNYGISVANCFSSATVRGSGLFGSVGSSYTGSIVIRNAFFCGELLSDDRNTGAGNFVGKLTGQDGVNNTRLYNCFSASLSPSSVGFADSRTDSGMSACCYLSSNSAGFRTADSAAGLRAKSTAFFKTKTSYTTSANWNTSYPWDFQSTWACSAKINNGFPYLKNMPFTSEDVTKTGTWNDYAASSFAGGNGTASSPYLIASAGQLARLARVYRYGGGEGIHFRLTADIDLAGHAWYPIAGGENLHLRNASEYYNYRNDFKGTIDGDNHTVSNMTVRSQGDIVGFIACLDGGSVSNLSFSAAEVTAHQRAGIVCGWNAGGGKIMNCTTAGKVQGADMLGGICGYQSATATLKGTKSSAELTGDNTVGGIVGYNVGSVEHSSFNGIITCPERFGGIAGLLYGTVKNCFTVNASGLFGNATRGTSISTKVPDYAEVLTSYTVVGGNGYVYGKCFGSENTPVKTTLSEMKEASAYPLFDFETAWVLSPEENEGYPVLRAYTQPKQKALPATSWSHYADSGFYYGTGTAYDPYLIATAGQLALLRNSAVNCLPQYAGKYFRLIRNIDLSAHLWPSENTGAFSTYRFYLEGNNKTISNVYMKNGGGLFDVSFEGYIRNLTVSGVSGTANCGIVSINQGRIFRCTLSGNFDVPSDLRSDNRGGGIAMENYGTIERCTVKAVLACDDNIGGITQYNGGIIRDCCVSGRMTARSFGFLADNNAGTVENCYANARGVGMSAAYYRDCSSTYVDYQASGVKEGRSSPAEKTTAQMMDKATYQNWNFESIWGIDPNVNGGYAYLRKPANRTITYHLNGGTNPKLVDTMYLTGNATTLPIPTRSGYAFMGWYTNASFSGAAVTKIAATAKQNYQLYAKWASGFHVKFQANGGKGYMALQGVPVGKATPLNKTRYARTCYRFLGWSGSKNGKVLYKNGASVKNLTSKGKTVTLYAVWQEGTHQYWPEWQVKTPPTYDKEGVAFRKCTECGKTITKPIAKRKKTSLGKASVTLSVTNPVYTGKAIVPEVRVVLGAKTLKKGTDYKVSCKSNVNVGTATLTVVGINAYSASVTKKFTIRPAAITGITSVRRTTSITLSWKAQSGVAGYQVYDAAAKKVIATLSGASANSFTVKSLSPGKAYAYRVRSVKKVDGNKYFGAYSAEYKTSTIPTTPVLKSVTSGGKGALKAVWTKQASAVGYQVQVSPVKDFSSAVTKVYASGASTVSAVCSSLTSGKVYYVRVRAYTKQNGAVVYGKCSGIKSFRVQ